MGGVIVPFIKGLVGHSDADVVLHAIMDAMLGAAGEGDIGDHFNPKDDQFKDISSSILAAKVMGILKKKKLRPLQINAVIVAEAPKLFNYKISIRKSLAKIFNVPASRVGLSVKTNEGFDAIGANKAIACMAVVGLK